MAKYISLEKLTLQEFLERMKALPYKKIRNRKMCWIKLIKSNKLTCPVSNKKVAYCSLDENQNRAKTLHYNFYAEDGTFMTIDHIIPKSKGGHHTKLSNIQPMTQRANAKKGDKILAYN